MVSKQLTLPKSFSNLKAELRLAFYTCFSFVSLITSPPPYTAKIEEVGVQPYLDTEYAKEWPTLIGQNWPGEATFNLNDVLAKYTKISIEPIFSYAVYADIKNNSRNTLYVSPSKKLKFSFIQS